MAVDLSPRSKKADAAGRRSEAYGSTSSKVWARHSW
ncbi:predicted protein [Botrytis cinerea T4]|uniref:Uncharacterized protein n=1 Tax=Botryotinia fuckeliana (strain T4) TaxID=999810 RepID=G2XVB0_BOTF4|nr:predicted protein [Botrytis cinerea T4]